jgi:hypothetical protein
MKSTFVIYGTIDNVEGFKEALLNRLLMPWVDKINLKVTHIDIIETKEEKPKQGFRTGLFLK